MLVKNVMVEGHVWCPCNGIDTIYHNIIIV